MVWWRGVAWRGVVALLLIVGGWGGGDSITHPFYSSYIIHILSLFLHLIATTDHPSHHI